MDSRLHKTHLDAMTFPNYRTGRKAHNPAALAATPSLAGHPFAAEPVPAVLDRRDIDFVPLDMGNKVLPICTAENFFNMARAIACLNGYDLNVDTGLAAEFYAETIGQPNAVDTALAATDGIAVLDMLDRQWRFGANIGPDTLHGQYGTLPLSITAIAGAVARLGAVGLGIRLYDADTQAMGTGEPLDAVPGQDTGALYGRHFLFIWDYLGLDDTAECRVGTWGGWVSVTWRWIMARSDEAHAVRLRQLDAATGVSVGAGINVMRLQQTA